jgi:hypothetical protein
MKTHRADGVSLTFAVLFFGVVTLWLFTQVLGVGVPKAGWFVAGALIVFGVLGLVGTLNTGKKQIDASGSDPAAAGPEDLSNRPES